MTINEMEVKNKELEEIISFPLSVDGFILCQEQAMGRALNTTEKRACLQLVPLFNEFYEDGHEGVDKPLEDADMLIDELTAAGALKQPASDFLMHFAEALCWWTELAWTTGQRSQKESSIAVD